MERKELRLRNSVEVPLHGEDNTHNSKCGGHTDVWRHAVGVEGGQHRGQVPDHRPTVVAK